MISRAFCTTKRPNSAATSMFTIALLLGCGATKPPITEPRVFDSSADAVMDTDNPNIVRVLAYRNPAPEGGECVDDAYNTLGAMCLADVKAVQPATTTHPSKGEFKFSSRLVKLEVSGNAAAAGSTVEATYSVATHQLVMEWSRFRIESFKGTKRDRPELGFVSAVERGIAIRVLFQAKLRDATAKTNLSFGFGQLAAALAEGRAEVLVRYETVGIKRDILPTTATISVTSVNDLVNVQSAFYKAIADVSDDWSAQFRTASGNSAAAGAGGAPSSPFDFDEPIAYYVTRGTTLLEKAKVEETQQKETIKALEQQQEQRPKAD